MHSRVPVMLCNVPEAGILTGQPAAAPLIFTAAHQWAGGWPGFAKLRKAGVYQMQGGEVWHLPCSCGSTKPRRQTDVSSFCWIDGPCCMECCPAVLRNPGGMRVRETAADTNIFHMAASWIVETQEHPVDWQPPQGSTKPSCRTHSCPCVVPLFLCE